MREWVKTEDRLPEDETPVLILFYNNIVRIGELRWERPCFEDTYKAFQYWDDPEDDGKPWEWQYVTHWAPIPQLPEDGE